MGPTDSVFRGNLRVGYSGNKGSLDILEIGPDALVLNDGVFRKKFTLTRAEVIKIEPVKYIPYLINGIRIQQTQKKDGFDNYYFWVWDLSKLVRALKEFNWLS